ncbi:MAG: hypothetical protein RL660_1874 [Bacteroidota bacterium]|jgi:hypothetical protein
MRLTLNILIVILAFAFSPAVAQTKPPAKPASKPASKSASKAKAKKGKKGSKDAELEAYFTGGKKGKNAKGAKNAKTGKTAKSGDMVDVKSIIKSKQTGSGPSAPPVDPNSNYGNRPVIVGNRTITGSVGTAQGYRICIYNGTSRKDALTAKQEFMKRNRDLKSYMRYNTPYYKIVIGDYEDKKAAQNALKKYVKDFPSAFLVPDVVNVKHIVIYQKR